MHVGVAPPRARSRGGSNAVSRHLSASAAERSDRLGVRRAPLVDRARAAPRESSTRGSRARSHAVDALRPARPGAETHGDSRLLDDGAPRARSRASPRRDRRGLRRGHLSVLGGPGLAARPTTLGRTAQPRRVTRDFHPCVEHGARGRLVADRVGEGDLSSRPRSRESWIHPSRRRVASGACTFRHPALAFAATSDRSRAPGSSLGSSSRRAGRRNVVPRPPRSCRRRA